jgi:hypothetical protein
MIFLVQLPIGVKHVLLNSCGLVKRGMKSLISAPEAVSELASDLFVFDPSLCDGDGECLARIAK